MQSAPAIVNRLRGRAIGVLFFTGFGALWLALGLFARGQLNLASAFWIAGGVLALAAGAMQLMRRAGRISRTPEDARLGRAFYWINALQWIAIFVVLNVLHRLHLDVYGLSAIAFIVGLHFFPLARLFRYPLHFVTGAVLVAWSIGAAWKAPLDSLQGITALGAGVILWASALLTLALAWRSSQTAPAARQPLTT